MKISRGLQTSFLNLPMAGKHGRILAKGCLEIWRKQICSRMFSLQITVDSSYVLQTGYIKTSQIPQLLSGKKRFLLTNRAALLRARPGCIHTITRDKFYKI